MQNPKLCPVAVRNTVQKSRPPNSKQHPESNSIMTSSDVLANGMTVLPSMTSQSSEILTRRGKRVSVPPVLSPFPSFPQFAYPLNISKPHPPLSASPPPCIPDLPIPAALQPQHPTPQDINPPSQDGKAVARARGVRR